jgi:hypothetical protein
LLPHRVTTCGPHPLLHRRRAPGHRLPAGFPMPSRRVGRTPTEEALLPVALVDFYVEASGLDASAASFCTVPTENTASPGLGTALAYHAEIGEAKWS